MSSKILPRDSATAQAAQFRNVSIPSGLLQPRETGLQTSHGDHPRQSDDIWLLRLDEERSKARAEGEQQGRKSEAQKTQAAVESLHVAIQNLCAEKARIMNEAESDMVKLSLAIARRILHREITVDPDAMIGLVKAASARLIAREVRRLRMSPGDARMIEAERARLGFPDNVELTADPSLPPGSAIFETVRGEMDASVDSQLAEIERGLTDTLKRRRAAP